MRTKSDLIFHRILIAHSNQFCLVLISLHNFAFKFYIVHKMDRDIVIPVLTSTKLTYIFSYDFITPAKPCEDLIKTFQCRCSSEICSVSHWLSSPRGTENRAVQLSFRQINAREIHPPNRGHRPIQTGAWCSSTAGGVSSLDWNIS